MKIVARSIALLLVLSVVAVCCTTKVELNAPYKSITVVFGLLDANVDTQFVKINRTWLGEGNNEDVATIRDSSEYDFSTFEARVEEVINGNVNETYFLDSITKYDKDTDGIFDWDGNAYTAYYFVPDGGVNPDADYRLEIDFDNKDDVSAVTNVIDVPTGNSNIFQPPAGLDLYKFNLSETTSNGVTYYSFNFKWASLPNAKRYEVSLVVNYTEKVWADAQHTDLVSETEKQLTWFLGTVTSTTDGGNEELSKEVDWRSFYSMLGNRLEASPFITRELGEWNDDIQKSEVFDFVVTIANDEMNTYMEVNEPVTGIIQERPQYTNIENGLGLFASRSQQIVAGVGITSQSVQELVEGQYTSGLNFCFTNPFQNYYCGD